MGLLNTIFGYTFFVVLTLLKLKVFISLFIATIGGLIFNYYTFGNLVFKSNKNIFIFIKFIFVYLISYIANVFLLKFFIIFLNGNIFIGQLICLFFIAILNWFLLNYWAYKNEK